MVFVLLTSAANVSNHRKCVSLNNKQCMTQSTLINLHSNEYSQNVRCYPVAVNLDRYVGSCNTVNDLSNKVCVPNKTKDLNISIFNMIAGINESKSLTKHISCKSKCKLYGRKCNSIQKWNNNKCQCDCKNMKEHHVCGFRILIHVVTKLANIEQLLLTIQ